jgi:FAD/FMN-containing dehydrogenase
MVERNWTGNHTYRAQRVAHPKSSEELQELVAGAQRVRALGSRHSFTDLTDTEGPTAPLYPRWEDFRALRAGADPDGKFGNAFLDRVLGHPLP